MPNLVVLHQRVISKSTSKIRARWSHAPCGGGVPNLLQTHVLPWRIWSLLLKRYTYKDPPAKVDLSRSAFQGHLVIGTDTDDL